MLQPEQLQLPQQIWIAKSSEEPPSAELMRPIKNHQYRVKPSGGLWTSTYDEEYLCDWHRWCLADGRNEWVEGKSIYRLAPRLAAVYTIDSRSDLLQLARKYEIEESFTPDKLIVRSLDFETMVRDGIDAIHLTGKGQWRTRFGDVPYDINGWSLYGWDCESTLWLKWCFEKVELFGRWQTATQTTTTEEETTLYVERVSQVPKSFTLPNETQFS